MSTGWDIIETHAKDEAVKKKAVKLVRVNYTPHEEEDVLKAASAP